MNNKKCPYCGFINFAQAEACRKCETFLTDLPEEAPDTGPPVYRGGVSSSRQPYEAKTGFTLGKLVICIAGLLFGMAVYVLAIRPHLLDLFTAKCEWTEYRLTGSDFTVTMPGKPHNIDPADLPPEARGLVEHSVVTEVRGQGEATFAFIDYSASEVDISKAEVLLDRAMNGALEKSKSRLISKTSVTVYGMPGIEFECEPPPGTFRKPGHAYGKLFINSNRLYMLFIAGVENSELLAGKDKFFSPKLGSVASKE